ncbi:MAG TPA: sulfate ABC transporter permease subunit CysW [Chloroflexota bacterium]
MAAKWTLRAVALGYVGLLLLFPVGLILWRTFQGGIPPVWTALTTPDALHALWLSVLIALIAVPANTIFGILFALMLVRHSFPGKRLLSAFVALPLGVSPIVVGLAIVLVYGRFGWFGPWLTDHNIQIIFALPGMVLATIFVCLPFVAREVVPVLQEIGTEQEQAAATLGASPLQSFWRITLPAIRAGVGYGVVLTTARALGEFGAVTVVSGRLIGQTETLTLYVEDRYQSFDTTGAYTASVTLAVLALMTVLVMGLLKPKKETV